MAKLVLNKLKKDPKNNVYKMKKKYTKMSILTTFQRTIKKWKKNKRKNQSYLDRF